ncbi:MAG: glycoside hydrolase family 2, partial [Acidobacteriota bacterium]
LMAARRLNNAIVAWTDLMDLRTYSWLASWMWVPTVAFWTLAWNRWCLRPWRSIDVAAIVLAVAGIAGSVTHSASATTACRLGSIALFVVIAVRIVYEGPMRIPPLLTLASIIVAFFGGEILDPIGVPGIWFPFGIGVSRTQYIYAIAVPLLAFLIVRTIQPERGTEPEPADH